MKIGIITVNFGRQRIFEIFCAGIDRLRLDTGLDIPCVCVGEEDDATMNLCSHYDIEHHYKENNPLTAKFNMACEALRGRVDYVMVMGTDNLISTSAFNAALAECNKGIDLIGFDSIYFYGLDDVHAGKLMHFSHTTVLGVGRTFSSRVLDKVNWRPWNIDRNRGIDVIALDAVRDHVETRSLLSGYFLVDLKTTMNLNPVNHWAQKLGYMASDSLLWELISLEESKLIKKYLEQ